ncbi:J domain-containing protein [Fluviicola taffensis]|uniref:Heat shock protein DnaJ domain protein n=1 Tax=Fluviicola taffensis (strain DSM 16823 / NCIMB 13979 / RW262) TaxID=755732 RepID=F2IBM4_FLUTR|nr:J domain-containing protein [Fluviicola taffensis]AEA45350.1 heat shock protein DnaJ domain protein [Fluviicola taffensis DSM 16823]
MTKAECFRLLGLPSSASEAEIRKQYKKMALRLHPDVNPDPLAHEAFIKLTKAVEIILNPDYKEEIITSRSSRKASTNESDEDRLERMRVAKMRYEQQKMQQAKDNDVYFKSLTSGMRWSIYKYIMRISVALSLAMTLEFFLPVHYETDVLKGSSKSLNSGILKSNITRIELENRGNYFVQNTPYAWMNCYPEVIIETTWFLHTPLKMITTDDVKRYRTHFDFHLGSIRFGLIIFFLIPLHPYLIRKKRVSFSFLYQFSFWGIGFVITYILLTQGRLIHLISFGFL